jgi:hypothetical protein
MRKLNMTPEKAAHVKELGRLDRNCIDKKSKTPNLRKPQRILRRAKRESR